MSSSASTDERTCLISTDQDRDEVTCRHVPARYVLVLLGSLAFTMVFSVRSSLSVAVVAMVNATSSYNDEASLRHGDSNKSESNGGEVDWDERTQGMVLGAYFYSYTIFQLAAGWVCQRMGIKNTLGCCLLLTSLLTFLLPTAARAAAGFCIVIRICQGVLESVLFPAMYDILAVWAPVEEHGRLVNFTYASADVGVVLGMLSSGFLCRYGFAGGWPSVFYVHGIVGCVWAFLWMVLVYDSPLQHPRLTAQEKAILQKRDVPKKLQTKAVPWCRLLKCPALWIVATNHFTATWGYACMALTLPTYMAQIQHFDIEENGALSSVPFLAQWLSQVVGSVLLDTIRSRRWLTARCTCLLLNGIGGALAAGFFVALGQVAERCHVLAMVTVTTAMACGALCLCSVRVIYLDLWPTHASSTFAITNSLAGTSGFWAPAFAGALTENQQTVARWRIFFCFTAALYLVCPILLCLISAGDRKFEEPEDQASDEEERTTSVTTEDPDALRTDQRIPDSV